jgi:hypothetical protein
MPGVATGGGGANAAMAGAPNVMGMTNTNGGAASNGVAGSAPTYGQAGAGGGGAVIGAGGATATGGAGTQPPGSGGTPPDTGVPPTPGCEGLLLCDDFEGVAVGGVPDPARWLRTIEFNPNSTRTDVIQIDNSQFHSGTRSVRVTGTSDLRQIVGRVTAERVFMRAWMRVSQVPSGGPVFVGIGADQNQDIRMRFRSGFVALNTGNGDGLAPDTTQGACAGCIGLTTNWFCTEMFVEDATESATVWINGQEAGSVVNNSGWHNTGTAWPQIPTPTQVRLGYWGLEGATAINVWIDDVAVGTERVGCD